MTDNEIKKALECCTTNGASCKNCPAFEKVDGSNCKKYFRGALDLINRLEKKNEAYKYYYEECLKDLKNANTENEKLKAKPIFVNSKIYDKQMEQKNIKAEARKEFAERLKAKFETTHLYGKDIIDRRIDNLLKEMDGE